MGIKRAFIAIFFAMIVLLSLFTLVLPKKSHSELENRDLQKAPVFSIDSLKSKRFMKDTETFLADHMVGRTYFVKAKTALEMAMGKREINGVYIASDRLMEVMKDVPLSATDASVAAINDFAQRYKDKLSVYTMLVPSASEFFSDKLPAFSMPLGQTQRIKSIYDQMENVNRIDVYASLASNTSGYIYYRTDHHWTSYGAYLGYTAMARPLGFKAATKDMFNIEHAAHDFLGTLYSKVLYGEDMADTVDLYHFAQAEVVDEVVKVTAKNTQTYPSVFFKENLEIKDKYQVFLGGNDALVKIKTNVENGKKIIVFKDSYANTLMQFLPLHYEEIALVDLRYLNLPLEEYLDIDEYSQALFLYSLSTFLSDTNIKKVSVFT